MPSGIKLKSGAEIDADIIITATGLKLIFGGGSKVFVDGNPTLLSDKFVWHGALLQDLPNFAFVFGYTNASWTLGADATAQLWVRILKSVRAKKMTSFCPRVGENDVINELPFLNLKSTYVKAAEKEGALPKAGDRGPWMPRSFWIRDIWHAKFGDIVTGLQLHQVPI